MKDENKIEVHKIEIKIGDKTISLKPEQAKELKKILNEMFEEQKVVHHHHDHYRYWWTYPTYSNISPYVPSYPQWTITCGGSLSGQQSVMQSYNTTLQGLTTATSNTCNTVQLALNAA